MQGGVQFVVKSSPQEVVYLIRSMWPEVVFVDSVTGDRADEFSAGRPFDVIAYEWEGEADDLPESDRIVQLSYDGKVLTVCHGGRVVKQTAT